MQPINTYVPEPVKQAFDFRSINYEDDTRLKRSTILKVSAVVVLILFIVFRKKIKEIFRQAPSGIFDEKNPYPNPDTEGYVTQEWIKGEGDYLIRTLNAVLMATASKQRCETYGRVNALSNNQIKAIYIGYFKKHSKSLTQHIGEQYLSGCTPFDTSEGDLLQERLKMLNLP